jgi:DNA-cytosine methyltransferase
VKVLSLFDGMSCCRLALEKLDVSVEKYYASEIDKYAIEVTQANYPDTEQLGDVTAWETWELDWASIDLVTGGFPCQAWSLAGKQLGDKDKRGKLFWTMLEVMAKVMAHNPKAFYLMENVKMKKEFESYITYHTEQALPNVYKYLINSALVSAQSRQRYYWTNIPGVEQPEDRGIVLRDILEHETDESHFVGADLQKNYQGGNQLNPTYKSQANTIHDSADKSATLAAGTHGYANGYVENPTADLVGKGGKKMLKEDIQKATALMARDYKGWNTYGMTGVRTKPKQVGKVKDGGQGNRIYSTDGKSSTLSAQSGGTAGNGNTLIETKPKQVGIAADINGHDVLKRVYSSEGKSPTLNSMGGGNREPKVVSGALRARSKNQDGKNVGWKETKPEQMLELRKDEKANSVSSVSKDSLVVNEELTWRKLTPLECERLQTVPDDYTAGVSNTQRYKMLGNGWTVDVIAHIFTFMQRAHNGEHLVTKGQQSLDF